MAKIYNEYQLLEKKVMDAFIGLSGTEITNLFHKLFYNAYESTWRNTTWMNARIFKCPLDLWVYQEIIYELKPDLIIECGTAAGGSALYLAQLCDLIDNGTVVTIDIDETGKGYLKEGCTFRQAHPRIHYLLGSSISKEIIDQVSNFAVNKERILVILDSCHEYSHVLQEMRLYQTFVTPGSYMIVEDTNINGNPVLPSRGPGPMEAINSFLNENNDFKSDISREKYFLTFNPKGYLKKIIR